MFQMYLLHLQLEVGSNEPPTMFPMLGKASRLLQIHSHVSYLLHSSGLHQLPQLACLTSNLSLLIPWCGFTCWCTAQKHKRASLGNQRIFKTGNLSGLWNSLSPAISRKEEAYAHCREIFQLLWLLRPELLDIWHAVQLQLKTNLNEA